METLADRFFVNLFTVGVPLGLIGLPLVLAGIITGIWLIWRERSPSTQTLLSVLVMVLGIAATIYVVIGTIEASK